MKTESESQSTDDPYDLNRFMQAQQGAFEAALAEIHAGQKWSHWMWFIFPQFDGLGFSPTSKHFSIKSIEEARAYLQHAVLGPRLIRCVEAVNGVGGKSAVQIFGSTDAMKLKSCATLFASLLPPQSVFDQLLDKYFDGEPDSKTLSLLSK